MSPSTLAVVFVVLAWWVGTGVVLWLVWQPRPSHRWSVLVASALAVAAVYGVYRVREDVQVEAAYVGFSCAFALWTWHELTFLLGIVTGPRREPARPGARGWTRFREATAAVIHHELALAATAAGLLGVTWDAPNRVATQVFLVLWIMRLSAKLNVFLGVPNLSEDFVPPHLRYLCSYFRRAERNPLLPVSIGLGALALCWPAWRVMTATSDFQAVEHSLAGTLLLLAVAEHLFLALPLRDGVLWRWIPRACEATRGDHGDA